MSDKTWRERITAFYQKHNRKQLGNVDSLLRKYRGKEEQLWITLQKKYKTKGYKMSRKERKNFVDPELDVFKNVLEGMEDIYKKFVKPVEVMYKFDVFNTKPLDRGFFSAKPMILLIGGYSVGKTTFIKYLLGRDFPGGRIGPEPVTDRFMAVMDGPDERLIPGHALVMQRDKPFMGLDAFGSQFLTKLVCSQVPANPLLSHVSLVDTPGILAGKKQKFERGYDFGKVAEWFAARADRIILLFDAHKLDVTDELKNVIQHIQRHSDKLRVVLNKADQVDGQELMRVYGSMMWGLKSAINTPEVPRVYISSFRDEPFRQAPGVNHEIMEAEKNDLLADLRSIPRDAVVRRMNEVIKRVRDVRTHALLISELRYNMPTLLGQKKAMQNMTDNLEDVFWKVQQKHNIAIGDFPDPDEFREKLQGFTKWKKDFNKYHKCIDKMKIVLEEKIPSLMSQLPGSDSKLDDPGAHLFRSPKTSGATEAPPPPPDGYGASANGGGGYGASANGGGGYGASANGGGGYGASANGGGGYGASANGGGGYGASANGGGGCGVSPASSSSTPKDTDTGNPWR